MDTDDNTEISAYPLCWPAGWERTRFRESGQFKGTPDQSRILLLNEIDRLVFGGTRTYTLRRKVILSTNIRLRQDGEPYASQREPNDPGVAVSFKWKKQPVCIACDKYDKVWKNMKAIAKTIEAMRGIERWGSSELLQRAFTGFAALPENSQQAIRSCWSYLDIPEGSDLETIKSAFRKRARVTHPDNGGSEAEFIQLTKAYKQALSLASQN